MAVQLVESMCKHTVQVIQFSYCVFKIISLVIHLSMIEQLSRLIAIGNGFCSGGEGEGVFVAIYC